LETIEAMIIALKLFLTPLFIALITLVGRRWGPLVSGLLMGLPLSSGPISIILAAQYGPEFASRSAVASLCGQASVCIFCLVYSFAARKTPWPASTAVALAAFGAATLVWNQFGWSLLTAGVLLAAVIALALHLIPRDTEVSAAALPPRWDLPARMALAAAFVFLLTSTADSLGPRLSGLISPLPVFGSVIAAFTHHQQGARPAARLLRGMVAGSWAFAVFFLTTGALLPVLNAVLVYCLAALAALGVGAGILIRSLQQARSSN